MSDHTRVTPNLHAGRCDSSHLCGKCPAFLPIDDSLPGMSRFTAVEDFTVVGLLKADPVQLHKLPQIQNLFANHVLSSNTPPNP